MKEERQNIFFTLDRLEMGGGVGGVVVVVHRNTRAR